MADNAGAGANERLESKYATGNFFPLSFDRVGFVDYQRNNWRLAPDSRYRGRATDRNDPGVNVDALLAAGAEKARNGLR
jgi:hypothetical protein